MGYRIDKETIEGALNDRALGLKVHEICNKYGISKESFYKYFRKRCRETAAGGAGGCERAAGVSDFAESAENGGGRVGSVGCDIGIKGVAGVESVKSAAGAKGTKEIKGAKNAKDAKKVGSADFTAGIKEFESGESAAKYCEDALEKIIDGGLSSGQKLERLRHVSEILTDRICAAAGDENQYTTVISSDRDGIKKAAAVCPEYTKKVDIKAIKDMASTVRVLTDCVRTLYGIPSFGESTRLYLAGRGLNSDGEATEPALTVKFTDGIDYAE